MITLIYFQANAVCMAGEQNMNHEMMNKAWDCKKPSHNEVYRHGKNIHFILESFGSYGNYFK